jgi:hypothetical protein
LLQSSTVFSVEKRVGRLLEIRIGGSLTLEEITAFGLRYREVAGVGEELYVACTDLRTARLFAPEAAELMLSFMRTRRTRIEHNAILVGDSPIVGLQAERLIKASSHPGRHILHSAGEVIAVLDPILGAAEQARVREFLNDG